MPKRLILPVAVLLAATAVTAVADEVVVGGDTYVSGANAELAAESPRDAVLSGFSVELSGRVTGDANAVGFDVDVDAPVGGDLYAAGFSVRVEQSVGEDLSALGFTVAVDDDATVAGNARLAGGNVVLEGAVAGSLVAAAGAMKIDGTVAGDARLTAGRLSFGPDARIEGTLVYSAREPVDIAASVIPADRVRFERLEIDTAFDGMGEAMEVPFPSFWPSFFGIFFGFVLTLAFLLVVAALAMALAPRLTEALRAEAADRPFRALLLGLVGLATLAGLVPVSGMTIIGLPLVPIVVLAIVLAWIGGYLLGAYALAWRVAVAFAGPSDTMAVRLLVLAAGLVVLALLNFIPFLGWLLNVLVVLLGIGVFTERALEPLVTTGHRAVPPPAAAGTAAAAPAASKNPATRRRGTGSGTKPEAGGG